jgi:hypothetical protein
MAEECFVHFGDDDCRGTGVTRERAVIHRRHGLLPQQQPSPGILMKKTTAQFQNARIRIKKQTEAGIETKHAVLYRAVGKRQAGTVVVFKNAVIEICITHACAAGSVVEEVTAFRLETDAPERLFIPGDCDPLQSHDRRAGSLEVVGYRPPRVPNDAIPQHHIVIGAQSVGLRGTIKNESLQRDSGDARVEHRSLKDALDENR